MTTKTRKPKWKYGFYDDAYPNEGPFWYVFGILDHDTAESALHTARKCVTGQAVIVRRRDGETEWEHVPPKRAAVGAIQGDVREV